MSDVPGRPAEQAAITIYCTQCGQAMLVAREHVNMVLACPHCRTNIEPRRVGGEAPPTVAQPTGVAPGYLQGVSSRHKVVAGVLGIVLGSLGVHRFYLGFIGVGILQIFVTMITGGIGGVWGFIEGILCLTGQMRDVDGLPLRD